MEKEGSVSLWLGRFVSEDLWNEYLEVSYSSDGDFEGSRFTQAFGIDYYDEDFKESHFYAQSIMSLSTLLGGFSYDDQITPGFETLTSSGPQVAYNCVLLLYNFEYDGRVVEDGENSSVIRYIGHVEYEV